MRREPIGLSDLLWFWAWALGSLLAVSFLGGLSAVSTAGVAVRATLCSVPIGIAVFAVLTQTQLLSRIPGRWVVVAWIVASIIAGIPEWTGGGDKTGVCYDRQGPYSC